MKTGILITARLGSTRLKKKHLLPVNDKPIMYYLIERIRREFEKELTNNKVQIIIATADEPENRNFEKFLQFGIYVFYGSRNNIPLRHYETAMSNGIDAIVSVDGDDILCSPKGMRKIYEALISGTQYAKTCNLPFGMNSSGYTTSFLASAIEHNINEILETGWGRVFDNTQLMEINIPFSQQHEELRFTLDYNEDYQFFKLLIEKCGDKIFQMEDEELVRTALIGELFRINEPINKQYWSNFYHIQKQEIENSQHVISGNNMEKL